MTIKEFDLLHKLLVDPTNARLVIGGDLPNYQPYRIYMEAISVFLWKILEKKFDFQRMVSHRLSKTLVDFANVIIKKGIDMRPESSNSCGPPMNMKTIARVSFASQLILKTINTKQS